MPSSPPRRRAARRSRLGGLRDRVGAGVLVTAAAVVVAAGLAALVCAALGLGPDEWGPHLSRGGAVAVVTVYVWGLAARTGGRPLVFGGLTLGLGVVVLVADRPFLATGAAVMTSVVAAVLAVVVTRPAASVPRAVGEVLVAVAVAVVGAIATVGFEPTVSVSRFEYVALGLALVTALALVYRLGAGLHGLGGRGLVAVLVGGALLALILAYAELLRRYGTPGLVETVFDGVAWTRERIGAFPRPLEALLGVPALLWGTHMRARRSQGWWVCVFGVAATAPVATSLIRTSVTPTEASLATAYAVVVGLVIGFATIRAELWLRGTRGRRDARAGSALRAEPGRTSPLL